MPPTNRDEHGPGNAAVKEINEQEGDEPQAVELGKVDAFARLRRRPGSLGSARVTAAGWLMGSGLPARSPEPRAGAVRPPRSKMRATSRSARSGPGPSVSGSWPGRTRWTVCRPARSVSRSLATVRSARLVRQATRALADQLLRRLVATAA